MLELIDYKNIENRTTFDFELLEEISKYTSRPVEIDFEVSWAQKVVFIKCMYIWFCIRTHR